jgi:tRNA threonylcarbamoyladenosine biosynthesis protein TsaE
MVINISHSVADTENLGRSWAPELRPGWVVGISGELGAGKTQLVRGIARGLAIEDRIHSPTFALVNEYRHGLHPLFHLDLYRLDTPESILSADLEDYFYHPRGISVIEWFEHSFTAMNDWIQNLEITSRLDVGRFIPSKPCRLVYIQCINETERRIFHEDFSH